MWCWQMVMERFQSLQSALNSGITGFPGCQMVLRLKQRMAAGGVTAGRMGISRPIF
jgi:hypothetical protein